MIHAFKSLMRKKLTFILIVFQLSFGLYMIISSSSIIIDKEIKEKNFARLFNYQNSYVMRQVAVKKDNGSVNIFGKYNRLTQLETTFEDLKNDGLIKSAKVFFSFPCKIDGLDEKCKEEYLKLDEQGQFKQFFQFTSKILINQDFLEGYDIKIKSGRKLEKKDFQLDYTHETIPILVGLDYQDKVNIGDTFKRVAYTYDSTRFGGGIKEVNVNFKVVGIMDKNAVPSLLAKSKFIENVVYSDSLVVIPTIKGVEDFSSGLVISDLGIFVELYDNSNISLVEDKINNQLKGTDINVSSYSLKKDYEDILANLKYNTKTSLILGVIITLISAIGIISIIVGNLYKRKKEFGIRICSGATIRTLCKEIFLEVALMNATSLIITYLFLYFSTGNSAKNIIFTSMQLLASLLVTLILTVIISAAPILIIRKMEPVELLKSK